MEWVKHCSSAEENIYQGKSRHRETRWEFIKDSHPIPGGRRESAVLCCVQLEIPVNISAVQTQGRMVQWFRHVQGIVNLFLLHPHLHLHPWDLCAAGKAAEKQNLHLILRSAAESPPAELLPLVDAEWWTGGLFTCQGPFPAWKEREKQPLILLSQLSWADLEATESK